ncbi:bifunctional adenosylcobinamide kinase/adenosylcobinamide-phosphate guanylyltransferase [Vibrio cincinnatiensis]|uniref:bifunctional adenosylcobinamide kinase/adenosylcobinamide-phosphate guanylyltransferase n=1 Tax=Vibrio cincinnatiensis TaxID=675 RepID=UPI001302AC0A|nr:bifunctional adenosylcobinamide kinase/adenosylcobinamide-phosphate guanylyltransferase [Vibrio cincinnatiensis]MCG3723719.1 bifunctional adenosylcobinamide kinase/adenosylcobinamide-phosphate guanylyltransferase [Vibrio cincinnatiensis]MCG3726764.1 bifunctional adenosylcobinamide kinase/adenosylcobinamide-phosphate guanylyltransferase [Vibrio cincinnatiensis]MCG3733502.1 bifunctional adenosylcobinamide kinase/adenosylcobinamide-phosphate guanylyltransferase [Vibrio cincinnatiensis]MCG373752
MAIQLILGGARSGKSHYAEQQAQLWLAEHPSSQLHYVATATACDLEMQARIAHHQQQRGQGWLEHEEPLALAQLFTQFSEHDIVLVDCLTLWLNNVIYNDGQVLNKKQIEQQLDQLLAVLKCSKARIVLVSNEVGMGIVPLGEVSRLFVDYAGWMNQAMAKVAQRVVFICAGLPLILKDNNG